MLRSPLSVSLLVRQEGSDYAFIYSYFGQSVGDLDDELRKRLECPSSHRLRITYRNRDLVHPREPLESVFGIVSPISQQTLLVTFLADERRGSQSHDFSRVGSRKKRFRVPDVLDPPSLSVSQSDPIDRVDSDVDSDDEPDSPPPLDPVNPVDPAEADDVDQEPPVDADPNPNAANGNANDPPAPAEGRRTSYLWILFQFGLLVYMFRRPRSIHEFVVSLVVVLIVRWVVVMFIDRQKRSRETRRLALREEEERRRVEVREEMLEERRRRRSEEEEEEVQVQVPAADGGGGEAIGVEGEKEREGEGEKEGEEEEELEEIVVQTRRRSKGVFQVAFDVVYLFFISFLPTYNIYEDE